MEGTRFITNVKRQENRLDAFWYYGDTIATIDFPNGKSISAEACGAIRIQFEEGGTFYKNDQAVEKARYELDLVDDDLNKIGLDFDGWDNNNWFAIREFDINGDMIGDDLGICHDYDDAIEMLKAVAGEKQKEYYS